jgi:hypothetical protein
VFPPEHRSPECPKPVDVPRGRAGRQRRA